MSPTMGVLSTVLRWFWPIRPPTAPIHDLGPRQLADHELDAALAHWGQGLIVARQVVAIGVGQQFNAQELGLRPEFTHEVDHVQ